MAAGQWNVCVCLCLTVGVRACVRVHAGTCRREKKRDGEGTCATRGFFPGQNVNPCVQTAWESEIQNECHFSPRPLGWNELIIAFRMNEPFEMLRRLAWKRRLKALQHIKCELQRLQSGGCRPSPRWPSKAPWLLTPPYELVLEDGTRLWSSPPDLALPLRGNWSQGFTAPNAAKKWSHRAGEKKGGRGN